MKNLVLKKNIELDKFDVVICTLQSEKTIQQCIESVLREIPVNKIVVVDGKSTDGTLDILKQFPKVDLYIKPDLNLGQSRAFGFSKVATDWFVLIDSDIVLQKGWFSEMVKDIEKGDIIEGGTIDHWAIPFLNTNHPGRAYFFNNLIKTEAVRGVELNCRHMEEELTRRYAESRGYFLYKNGCLLSDHYSNSVRYQGEQYRATITRKSTPDWTYIDYGRIDWLGGVTLFAALVYFLLTFFLNIFKGINYTLNEEKKNILYLKGYFQALTEKKIIKKGYKIGIIKKLKKSSIIK